mmetsp:Transcript_72795/g.213345  ORF Transcript_72795/g.213345 Transcript_72795/m.213345 type:complete len:210 (+) Transcript_72795:1-630(+)
MSGTSALCCDGDAAGLLATRRGSLHLRRSVGDADAAASGLLATWDGNLHPRRSVGRPQLGPAAAFRAGQVHLSVLQHGFAFRIPRLGCRSRRAPGNQASVRVTGGGHVAVQPGRGPAHDLCQLLWRPACGQDPGGPGPHRWGGGIQACRGSHHSWLQRRPAHYTRHRLRGPHRAAGPPGPAARPAVHGELHVDGQVVHGDPSGHPQPPP